MVLKYAQHIFPGGLKHPLVTGLNRPTWGSNLLVRVGQITRQRINYFYFNKAISMSDHRHRRSQGAKGAMPPQL